MRKGGLEQVKIFIKLNNKLSKTYCGKGSTNKIA